MTSMDRKSFLKSWGYFPSTHSALPAMAKEKKTTTFCTQSQIGNLSPYGGSPITARPI